MTLLLDFQEAFGMQEFSKVQRLLKAERSEILVAPKDAIQYVRVVS